GYDGTTVAADACYVAKHVTGRSRVVLAETLNPQVRQVVKTYAPGFGLEVVEVPHRNGVTDPDELGEAARDAACAIFQQPNFFGCLEPAPDLAAAASEAGALAVAHVDPRAAHPPREGDLEHHHEPDAAGARRARPPLVAGSAGAPRAGGDLHGPRRLREGTARPTAFVSRSDNVQGVCHPGRTARRGG